MRSLLNSVRGALGFPREGLVFISYRRDDAAAAALKLQQAISREANVAVFYDQTSLEPGARFPDRIQDALARMSVLLAVVGPNWSSRGRIFDDGDYVRREIEAGLNREDCLVVPVFIDKAKLPDPAEVPGSLLPLLELQAIPLRFRPEDIDRDVSAIVRLCAQKRRLSPFPTSKSAFRRVADARLPNLGSAERDTLFYGENRRVLTDFVRPYYQSIDRFPSFPLITLPGWIEPQPLELTKEVERVMLDDDLAHWTYRQPPVSTSPMSGEMHHQTKARVFPTVPLFDGDAYRLIEVNRQGGLPRWKFSMSSYFNYINTCEIVGVELAKWYLEKSDGGRIPPLSSKGDLPLRGTPSHIFNFRDRHALVGQNILLIVLNHLGEDCFYLHKRSNVIEARGMTHVIPAGTFAPEREGDGFHARDFSLRRNAFREFAEELLSVEEARAQVNTIDTFTDAAAMEPFLPMFESGEGLRIYHLGLGIDPLTTKPEALGCMVLDMALLSDAGKIRFHDRFESEGRSRAISLNRRELSRWAEDPEVLSAGRACIQLVSKHYDFLFRGRA